jgi:hypothetical protein
MHTPDRRWQLATTAAANALHQLPSPWWQEALIALRQPVWSAVVAALMVFGLLLAFQQVVAQGVEQSEQRRTATALQLEGAWRCKLLRNPGDRDSCLAQLGGARDPLSLRRPNGLAAVAVVHNEP